MRSRNIKPGLYKDEELAALPLAARYLFPGLWLLADCKGRLEDRPRWIKSEVYPYDDDISAASVHELLQALHNGGFIRRYAIGKHSYIQVVNFERHQNPHKNEAAKGSQIPDPTEDDAVPIKSVLVPINSGQVPIKSESVGMIPDFLIPDSLLLITESSTLKPAESVRATSLRWKRDPEFAEFAKEYAGTKAALIDDDFSEAYEFCWKTLDFEQKAKRLASLEEHIEEYRSNPRFVPKPLKFLQSEWARPRRPPAANGLGKKDLDWSRI